MHLEESIQKALAVLEPTHLECINNSASHAGHGASGAHIHVRIAVPAFKGLSRVAAHRKIYAALGDLMQGPIHALEITLID